MREQDTGSGMKHIVFDLGAVVLHWQPAQLLKRLLPDEAHDEASAAHWVNHFFQGYQGEWGRYDRGSIEPDELVQRLAARTGLTLAQVKAVVDAVPVALQPLPDTVALIQRLRAAGHVLHYLSNMPAPCADVIEEREAALFAHFASGVFSGRVQLIKPEPAIYALAQARFGVPASELVFLDDHEPNVQAARALGWQALHFHNAAQAELALQAAGWIAAPRSLTS